MVMCVTIDPIFFFFNDTATTEIYTLSLHDALPIYRPHQGGSHVQQEVRREGSEGEESSGRERGSADRKSTRLNSSHGYISYAVFCLKKKKKNTEGREISVNAHCTYVIRIHSALCGR